MSNGYFFFCLWRGGSQLKDGVATQQELDDIKAFVLESYEKDFEVIFQGVWRASCMAVYW